MFKYYDSINKKNFKIIEAQPGHILSKKIFLDKKIFMEELNNYLEFFIV